MSWEIITCPLSACFLGMSRAQADAAEQLSFSDARGPIDAELARQRYNALPSAEETGDGRVPSFFDRMFRRVGQGPLSRHGAEESAAKLLDTLRALGIIEGDVDLTTAAAEDFHGHIDARGMDALRHVLATPDFMTVATAVRIERLRQANDGVRPAQVARAFPNLTLTGQAALFLPTELSRPVQGAPHDIGSLRGLAREIDAVRAAFDLTDRALDHDDPRASAQRIARSLGEAVRAAKANRRVLVTSR